MKKEEINSSTWVSKGKELNINLKEILYQDKKGMYFKLDELGLPRQKTLFFPAEEYNKHEKEIRDFIDKNNPIFSRLLPLKGDIKRPYKIGIIKYEELIKFIENANINLRDYELHIVENGNQVYSGTIINNDKLVAELLRGHNVDLVEGWATPMNAILENNRFRFSNDQDYTEEEKSILLEAIKMINGIKGYFEFVVLDNGRFMFKNYQDKGGFTRI